VDVVLALADVKASMAAGDLAARADVEHAVTPLPFSSRVAVAA
jgi:hypothetical protein